MSQFWHKPLNVAATVVVVIGMMGLTATAVNARVLSHARSAATSHVTFSDQQFVDAINPFQVGAVVDTETTGLTQPSGNLGGIAVSGKPVFYESTTPKASDHNLVYKFYIHRGMKWSTGSPITNKDFLFSWHIGMNKNTGACSGTCDQISSVTLLGKYGVKVRLKTPVVTALQNVILAVGFQDSQWALNGADGVKSSDLKACINASASNGFAGCDKVATTYEDPTVNYFSKKYATAGPYQVASYDSTSGELQFTINKNYTGAMPGGRPKVKTMTFIPYGGSSTETAVSALIAAAAAGDTDVTQDYALNNVGGTKYPGTLKYYHNFKTLVASNASPEVLTFNQYNKNVTIDNGAGGTDATNIPNPFAGSSGRDVRLALLLAFNRAKMIQTSFAPLTASAAKGLVSYCAPIICTSKSKAPFYDKSIKGAWDSTKNKYETPQCATPKSNGGDGSNSAAIKDAKKLLAKAGYGPGHKHLTIYISSTTKPYRYTEQAYLQSCWQALGNVTVKTENIKSSIYFAPFASKGTLAIGHFEADLHGYGGVTPDPDGWKGNFLGVNCPQKPPNSASQANIDCFNDKVINKALTQGGHSFKTATRQKWYSAFQEEVVKQGDWSITAPLPQIFTWNGKPKGFQMNAWVNSDTWNSFKWR
jgi:ABC-type transport system substrate-binding protein